MPSRTLPRPSPWPRALLLGLFAAAGCKSGDDDFRCGTRSGDKTRTCDRSGEVCVCATNRCAAFDDQCADEGSHLRYLFGNQACVTTADERSVIDQNSGGDLCPGEAALPKRCGVAAAGGGFEKCATGQLCDCRTNTCVVLRASCTDGGVGVADPVTNQCQAGVEPTTCLLPAAAAVGACPGEALPSSGVDPRAECAGYTPPPLACGRPADAGIVACPGAQVCLCSTGECAVSEPACADGGVGFAAPGSDPRRCIEIDEATECAVVGDAGACPGFAFPPPPDERAVCSPLQPPLPQCGQPLPDGGFESCPTGQLCICSLGECAVLDPNRCPGEGYRLASTEDGRCIGDLDPTECLLREDAGACPGFVIPTPGMDPRASCVPLEPDGGLADGGTTDGGVEDGGQ